MMRPLAGEVENGGQALRRLAPLAALAALISLALVACGGDDDGVTPVVQPTTVSPAAPAPAPADTPAAQVTAPASTLPTGPSDVTRVSVVNQDPGGSGKYAFDPADLSFKVGETVEFTLLGETEFHTFTVDDVGIDEALDAGETVVFTFTFDTAGTFDLICLSHPQMTGTITVK